MKKKLLLAAISGVILVFAFSPFEVGYLAWFGFVPLFLALESVRYKDAFITGWVWGAVFFLGTVYWVVHSMYFYGGMGLSTAIPAMLLLVFFLAIFTALFSTLFAATAKLKGIMRLFSIPFLWVSFEYLRGTLFTGFPWVLLGYSQIKYLTFIQIADITGVWGVSFWTMALNSAAYMVIKGIKERRGKEVLKAVFVALLISLVVTGYGVLRIKAVDREVPSWPPLRALLVQGNIEQGLKWEEEAKAQTVEAYRDLTLKEKSYGPELVVFPESAMPFYLFYDRGMGPVAKGIAKEVGSYLLTGAPHYSPNLSQGTYNLYNSAFLISPSGEITERYDKIHLVPFGEYVPLKKILFFIRKLTYGIGDFVPGPGAFPLRLKDDKVGVLICYEAIFPELSAGFLKNGATIIVNMTNDAWFGKTSAPYQHFEMSIMRAVEGRVFLLRAANTGISAVVDPTGRVIEKTALFTAGVIKAEARFRRGDKTRFARHSAFFPFTSLVISAILIVLAFTRRR